MLKRRNPRCLSPKQRIVPAFSIQSYQRGTVVKPPPKTKIEYYAVKKTPFQDFCKFGNSPMKLDYSASKKIVWQTNIESLDYQFYLPIFFEGLCETKHPYKFLAHQGILEMLCHGKNKILPVLPQLIPPIKKALNTRDPEIVISTLKVIQMLVISDITVGKALVPYYRQILPALNSYKDMNVNCGDSIDFSYQKKENIGDLVRETLEILEKYGGQHAFINIKYMVPTYESSVSN